MPADDLSGPIAPENALPPTRSDADRREALLVDTFSSYPQRPQQMLDNRNALEAAGEACVQPITPVFAQATNVRAASTDSRQ